MGPGRVLYVCGGAASGVVLLDRALSGGSLFFFTPCARPARSYIGLHMHLFETTDRGIPNLSGSIRVVSNEPDVSVAPRP